MNKKNNWKVIQHPLIQNSLTKLRDKNTGQEVFVNELKKISSLLVFETLKKIKTESKKINTPFQKITSEILKQKVILIPILRAGIGMLDSFQMILPEAKIGHIGLKRNEKKGNKIEMYYVNLPEIKKEDYVIILDVMIATGNSAIYAIKEVQKQNKNCNITFASVITSENAKKNIDQKTENISFFTTVIDPKLNEKQYIIPGLGDAGDRFFGC